MHLRCKPLIAVIIASIGLAACGASTTTPTIPAAAFAAATRDFNAFVAAVPKNVHKVPTAAQEQAMVAPIMRMSANADELAAFHQQLETAYGKSFPVAYRSASAIMLLAAKSPTWLEATASKAWETFAAFAESVGESIKGELTVGNDAYSVAQPAFFQTGLTMYTLGMGQRELFGKNADACLSGNDPICNDINQGKLGAALNLECPGGVCPGVPSSIEPPAPPPPPVGLYKPSIRVDVTVCAEFTDPQTGATSSHCSTNTESIPSGTETLEECQAKIPAAEQAGRDAIASAGGSDVKVTSVIATCTALN
jgi:hypothetical protein